MSFVVAIKVNVPPGIYFIKACVHDGSVCGTSGAIRVSGE